MKKAICFGLLPYAEDPHRRMELARAAGFDGIEIFPADDPWALQSLREAADQFGLEIHSILDPTQWSEPLTSPDPEIQKRARGRIRGNLGQAQRVGAGALLLVPGVVNEETPYEAAYDRLREALAELAPAAEDARVALCLENVWNRFLLSPREMVGLIDDIGSDYVRAYFDVGNILLYGYPQHWIRSLGPRIARVHVKDFECGSAPFPGESFRFVPLLQGDVPWPQVMAALREIGYNGYLTVEVGPHRADPEFGIYEASRALDRILALGTTMMNEGTSGSSAGPSANSKSSVPG